MAFAEQQRWITVQQKTFTKWLNTKVEARGLEVKDLVQDLSDGVCSPQVLTDHEELFLLMLVYSPCLGHAHPSTRMSL